MLIMFPLIVLKYVDGIVRQTLIQIRGPCVTHKYTAKAIISSSIYLG